MKNAGPFDLRRGAVVCWLSCIVLLLVSPLRGLWARVDAPWWSLTVLWLALIVGAAGVARLWEDDGR